MDIVDQCLSIAPLPHFTPAFTALKLIYRFVKQAPINQRQLQGLVQSIAQLLRTLDEEHRDGRLLRAQTSVPLVDLSRFVICGLPWILCSSKPVVQPIGRNWDICSEAGLFRILEAASHQRSKNISD
jgi:hypothetical protein